jgi:site-specific DNA-adenine methylase
MKADSKYYGLPFKGSKTRYAKELFDLMPHGGRLVDLFCGGCSMTDYAMKNKLYDSYLANDKDTMVTKAYIEALNGELVPPDMRFISKDDFHSHPEDPYSHICYSFNCRLVSYMYGTEAEVAMKAAHYVACYDDYSLIKAVINSEALLYLKEHIAADDFYTRRLQLTTALRELTKNGVDIGSMYMEPAKKSNIARHLCKVNQVLSVAKSYDNLTTSNISYEQYEHHDGDVVYCDPPYTGTDEYRRTGVFDTEKFWQWARTREYPVYVSEFKAPDDFVSIWKKERLNTFSRPTAERNCQQRVVENLFIHERFL